MVVVKYSSVGTAAIFDELEPHTRHWLASRGPAPHSQGCRCRALSGFCTLAGTGAIDCCMLVLGETSTLLGPGPGQRRATLFIIIVKSISQKAVAWLRLRLVKTEQGRGASSGLQPLDIFTTRAKDCSDFLISSASAPLSAWPLPGRGGIQNCK